MTTAAPSTLAEVRPGDPAYEDLRHTYAARGAPDLIVRAATVADVQRVVALGAESDVPLAIRSGGHGASTNAGGYVLDLGPLRGVRRIGPADGRMVRIGPGSRWGEVAAALDHHDLAISSGDFGDVGVGGLATGGGIGLLARLQGLTIDRIRAAEVVLADGHVVRADEHRHPDLLWAIRGAGGAFGVVTAFEMEAERVGVVTAANFAYATTRVADLVESWASLVAGSARSVTSFLYLQARPSGGAIEARATVIDSATEERDAVASFRTIAPVREESLTRVRYASLLGTERQPHHGQAEAMATRGGLIDRIDAAGARELESLLTSGAAMALQVRSIGGAVNDVDAEATAFPHRTQSFSLVSVGTRDGKAILDAAWEGGIGSRTEGTYLNLETGRDEGVLRRAFPGATLQRLREIKRRYDPEGLFAGSLPLPA